ncbi:MAG: DUF937 domain-containing protein [Steroidobacteraceae bacterium]|nr:DUF937 domain-containing protein [Steroidobacteraceae bacterium]MDW8257876.1 DUF937 domain-containing protein [Gammaproteobacteria bacterium]
MSPFEYLRSQVSEELVGALAARAGETPAAVRAGLLEGAVPAVAGGLIQRHAADKQLVGLSQLLRSGPYDGSLFADLAGALGGGAQTDTLVALGTGLLKTILADRVNPVAELVGKGAKLRPSTAADLLALAAPLLLSALGREACKPDGAVDVAALSNVFNRMQTALGSEAPRGLAAALGAADLQSLAGGERKSAVYPWLLVPAIALSFFAVLRSCSRDPAPPIPASFGQPALEQPRPGDAPTSREPLDLPDRTESTAPADAPEPVKPAE